MMSFSSQKSIPGTRVGSGLINHPAINKLAGDKAVSVAQLLLAWVISHAGVMAIPKAVRIKHVQENAAAQSIKLSLQDIAIMEKAFPAAGHKTPLEMV